MALIGPPGSVRNKDDYQVMFQYYYHLRDVNEAKTYKSLRRLILLEDNHHLPLGPVWTFRFCLYLCKRLIWRHAVKQEAGEDYAQKATWLHQNMPELSWTEYWSRSEVEYYYFAFRRKGDAVRFKLRWS